MPVTLTEFLLARIAEDEATARAASGDHWDRLRDGDPKFRKVVAWGLTPIGAMNAEQDAEHISHHDPARVLARCEADRRIVELHGGDYDGECQSPAHLDGPCRTLRALALPYADHPDYDEEWKP